MSKRIQFSFLALIVLCLSGCGGVRDTPIGGLVTGRNESLEDYLINVTQENQEDTDQSSVGDEYASAQESHRPFKHTTEL